MIENISDRDHTYLKTKDNVYFAVSGNLHTQDTIFGQPYYFPKKTVETILDRQIQKTILIGDDEFCKLLDVLNQEDYPIFIKENFSKYYYSPEMWPLLMRVKREDITQVLDPKQGLINIRQKYQNQEDSPLIYFLKTLEEYSPILYQNTGITGSLLLHHDLKQLENDADLVIYGQQNVDNSKEFSSIMCKTNKRFSFLDDDKLEEYLDTKSKIYSGTREQLAKLVKRRWDTYFVDKTKIDLTFSSESKPNLESYDLTPLGIRMVSGIVTDTQNSYFLPTEIKVRNQNGNEEDIIITSRGYICLFQESDQVDIYGEEYISENSGKRYTVVKGSKNYFLTKNNE